MGAAAIGFQRALRHLGVVGDVYADEVAEGFDCMVRPVSSLTVEPDDLVLYHHGIASRLVARLLHLPCRRGLVFHNVTPARFYAGTRLEQGLRAGRAQVSALVGHVEVAIGVSRFNAKELEAAGHRDVKVVPLLVEPERFEASQADPAKLSRWRQTGSPRVIAVGRVVPHKRLDDVLSFHAELSRLAPNAHLSIVGGLDAGQASAKALVARARHLGRVSFLGRVSHAELVAAYRSADLFVSMSEHEGLGVPLLEAFASDVPVLAFGAAAVPETLGGCGVMFDEKHFAALAEVAHQLVSDAPTRARVVEGQRQRLEAFSLTAVVRALNEALSLKPAPRRRPTKRPRVAFVVQRFGDSIVGGAEAHARQVALKLAPQTNIEIFTTAAVDHLSWEDTLPIGTTRDGPLTVHRFASSRRRHIRGFNRLSRELLGRPQDLVHETRWVADQGPVARQLLHSLRAQASRFDAVAFFTALYQPTVFGVPLLSERALLVPTAHDEPPMAFPLYADAFERARALLCNTPEEVDLIRSRFPRAAPTSVVGVGVDALEGNPTRFRKTVGLDRPYLLYVGRMEAGKGVSELLTFHARLVRAFHDAPTLVLAGSGELEPRGERVVALGRIDEQLKWDALSGALAVVVPSQYESLSLLALEAFAAGVPLIGNAHGAVVRGQLMRSKAGVGYRDAASFIEAVREVGERRAAFVAHAKRYAKRHQWSTVIDGWMTHISRVQREVKR